MIYFDNNATTPLLPEVLEAMMADLDGIPRNPSSITSYGREGKHRLNQARRTVADYLGLSTEEIIFTSGATESNYLLIQGFAKKFPGEILTSPIEHMSLLEPLRALGTPLSYVPVGESGAPTIEAIHAAITPKTSLMFFSAANNETGALLPLEEVASLAKSLSIPLIIDAAAFIGKANLHLPLGVSALSFSGHKIHGPKGIGVAAIRKPFKISPLFRGGHQERGMRAGTENLPAILGLAKALTLIPENAPTYLRSLQTHFEELILTHFPFAQVNSKGARISNTSNIFFEGQDAETLLIRFDQLGLITSLGSACSAGALEPSHVLLSMGYSRRRALSSLRFSFSRQNSLAEIERAIALMRGCMGVNTNGLICK